MFKKERDYQGKFHLMCQILLRKMEKDHVDNPSVYQAHYLANIKKNPVIYFPLFYFKYVGNYIVRTYEYILKRYACFNPP